MQGPGTFLDVATYPPGALATQARIVIDGDRGAIFLYTNGGPLGALVGSWASSAGTDPYGNVYPQGFQINSGVIEGPEYIINSSGEFFYNGTPAAGTLMSSIASAPGTDAFGNAYLAGTTSYFEFSPSLWMATQQNEGELNFWTATSSAGPYTSQAQIGMGTLQTLNLSSIVAANPNLTLNAANTQAGLPIVATNPSNGNPEAWHTATLLNGWTGTLAYRLTAQGDLQIHADLVAGTTTNATNIFTFPAAYRPAQKARIPAAFDGSVAAGGNPYFILNIDGTFTVHWVTSTQTNGGFEATVRLT